ncbi:MAG: M23 family metallopeptidase [bacterium]
MKKIQKKPLLARTLGSHPISQVMRPYMERKGFVKTLTMQGVAVLTLAQVVIFPTHAFDYKAMANPELDLPKVEMVTTETTFAFPVSEPLGISQGYHTFHRGIDVRASKGTAVVAVEEGTVVEVGHLRGGYGENVRIAHKGTIASLYAHLSNIEVTVGQKVEKGQEIGTVGTTGWATGPHLHFEITEGERTVNPELWL